MSSKRDKDHTDTQLEVLTIGHSTRTIGEFVRLLQAHSVACVADVRTVPRSWHNPQFNRDTLPASLEEAHIGYEHMAGLGGLRHAQHDSINMGWRNASFRGYADYMQTPEFERSLQTLIKLAKRERVALMCAEAVPWRCHRSMIADALVIRGIQVEDIMSINSHNFHALTSFAKVKGTHITYPPEESVNNELKLKKSSSVRQSRQRLKIKRNSRSKKNEKL